MRRGMINSARCPRPRGGDTGFSSHRRRARRPSASSPEDAEIPAAAGMLADAVIAAARAGFEELSRRLRWTPALIARVLAGTRTRVDGTSLQTVSATDGLTGCRCCQLHPLPPRDARNAGRVAYWASVPACGIVSPLPRVSKIARRWTLRDCPEFGMPTIISSIRQFACASIGARRVKTMQLSASNCRNDRFDGLRAGVPGFS